VKAFAWFVAALAVAIVAGALVAYPAYELVHGAGWRFDRVASRVAMLLLAVELIWLCRHLGIQSRADFGYDLPRSRFIAQALLWGLLGMASAAAGAAWLLTSGLRAPAPGFVPGVASGAHLLLLGLGSGAAVALIEESVMRGGLHTAIARESGPLAAALLTATLFAVLHLFAKARIPADELAWYSGFDLLQRSFAVLAHPLAVLDTLAAWTAVFLVLSLTRILTGNIAVAIGLHGGWVVVLRILQEATVATPGAASSPWVGRFDGLLGLWMLPWAAGVAAALWLTRRLWVPRASRG
jgi:membrane protease YdiL (CAAX protease family)